MIPIKCISDILSLPQPQLASTTDQSRELPVKVADAEGAVASTEIGSVYSFADNDMNNANGINHTQTVKKDSTYKASFPVN